MANNTSVSEKEFVSCFRKRLLIFCAFVATRWLRKDAYLAKKELISTRSFILKAERTNVPDKVSGGTKLLSTFSLHMLYGPNEIGPQPSWWYEKYELLPDSKEYKILRYGKYPASWE